jgi:hypothetical protein
MITVEFEAPTQSRCECCGSVTVRLTRFVYRDGDAYAVYYAQYTEGHDEKRVSGLVSLGEWGDAATPEERLAFPLQIWMDADNFQVGLVSPADSPWSDVTFLGRILNRDEALGHERIGEVFDISDRMVTDDPEITKYFGTHAAAMTREVACSVCGNVHPVELSELVFRLPDVIHALPEDERTARCDIGSDVCALDRERFFLRGLLPIPVLGRPNPYNAGVWAEISLDTYKRIYERWDDADQGQEPRLPGTLANSLPLQDQQTLGLAISIQLIGPKHRPQFYVEVRGHSLYREQTQGVDEHRAIEYSDRERRPADRRQGENL